MSGCCQGNSVRLTCRCCQQYDVLVSFALFVAMIKHVSHMNITVCNCCTLQFVAIYFFPTTKSYPGFVTHALCSKSLLSSLNYSILCHTPCAPRYAPHALHLTLQSAEAPRIDIAVEVKWQKRRDATMNKTRCSHI